MSDDEAAAIANGNCKQADQGAQAAVLTKLVYQSPLLTIFGSVRELTGSGTGGAFDGGMPMA